MPDLYEIHSMQRFDFFIVCSDLAVLSKALNARQNMIRQHHYFRSTIWLILFFCASPIFLHGQLPALHCTTNTTTISIPGLSQPLYIKNSITASHPAGESEIKRLRSGSYERRSGLVQDSGKGSCKMTEVFTVMRNRIHVQVVISTEGNDWGSTISTTLNLNGREPLPTMWTAWASPPANGVNINAPYYWNDPLQPAAIPNSTFYYGAPPFNYDTMRTGFIPFQDNLFCIPMISLLYEKSGRGITLALSPDDQLIDLELHTNTNGQIRFDRLSNRISKNNLLRFSYDLMIHDNNWQDGLNWMRSQYPAYFYPENPMANRMAGTGAYAAYSKETLDFDARKMKQMAFTVNWQASFDFPYMGLFLPPVKPDETWKRFGGGTISVNEMDRFAKSYRDKGFHVLNYFNVTEFGTAIKFPPDSTLQPPGNWQDATSYLYNHFKAAILPMPKKAITDPALKNIPGAVPYFTWEYGIAMDCGDNTYSHFLLDQLDRHIREIPSSSGICIDRLDWLRMFNENADDGISWFDGKPARSLISSWKKLAPQMASRLHGSNKVLFVNNHTKRLDILKQVDGLFDEFTYSGSALNLTAFLTLSKPALGWTDNAATIRKEGGDHFFQKYLYMGVFPMCPFPLNDHSITSAPDIDSLYLDYGPMLNRLKGKSWYLQTRAVAIKDKQAKINLFKIDGGYAIPVVYGNTGTVELTLKKLPGMHNSENLSIYYPGKSEPVTTRIRFRNGQAKLNLALERNCALVVVEINQ